MAAIPGPPIVIPPVGPPVLQAPQLPFAADPGSLTGWLVDESVTGSLGELMAHMNRGFNRLTDGVPDANHATYPAFMRNMVEEVVGSDTLVTYLVTTNVVNEEPRVTVVHSMARYSAGFGGSNALHGWIVALLRETVGTQLPTLVSLSQDPDLDLAHALTQEECAVPSDAQVDNYL